MYSRAVSGKCVVLAQQDNLVLSQTFHAMVPAQSYVMRRDTLNTKVEYCVSKYSASSVLCLGRETLLMPFRTQNNL